jgi:hypothetical protein
MSERLRGSGDERCAMHMRFSDLSTGDVAKMRATSEAQDKGLTRRCSEGEQRGKRQNGARRGRVEMEKVRAQPKTPQCYQRGRRQSDEPHARSAGHTTRMREGGSRRALTRDAPRRTGITKQPKHTKPQTEQPRQMHKRATHKPRGGVAATHITVHTTGDTRRAADDALQHTRTADLGFLRLAMSSSAAGAASASASGSASFSAFLPLAAGFSSFLSSSESEPDDSAFGAGVGFSSSALRFLLAAA